MTPIVPDRGKIQQAMQFIEQTMDTVGNKITASLGAYLPSDDSESIESPEALASDAIQQLIRSNIKAEMKKPSTETPTAQPYNAPKSAAQALAAASAAIAARIPAATYLATEPKSDITDFLRQK
jgi:hypothetical protein